MITPFELILPDDGCSFRTLYHKVKPEVFQWNYHFHPEFELVFVTNGSGRRHVGNHSSYYQNGDLVLIGSNVPHSGFGFGALGVHEEIVVQFKEDFLGSHFFDSSEMSSIKKLLKRSMQGIAFGTDTKEKAASLFLHFKDLPPLQRLTSLLHILHFLSESEDFILLNTINSNYQFHLKDQTRLHNLFQFVEQNYQKPISTPQAAEITHLTVPAFCNYFKKYMNANFTDFVNEYRINKASILLSEGRTISEVCFDTGFNSLAYFSRTFKYFKGLSPSEFKKNVR